jgi:aldose 1-epimerase
MIGRKRIVEPRGGRRSGVGCGLKSGDLLLGLREDVRMSDEIIELGHPGEIIVRVTSYGCTVMSLSVPDRQGRMGDVVLGFDTVEEYRRHTSFFGCVTGRFANRIAGGRVPLDGEIYSLPINNFPGEKGCHLHGGNAGFNAKGWEVVRVVEGGDLPGVVFRRRSPDGEEGYPGNLDCEVEYRVGRDRSLRMDYRAVTDRPTVLNLTNHSYFQLAGEGCGLVSDHELRIDSEAYIPVDEGLIPTGACEAVGGTVFDFRRFRRMGEGMDSSDEQVRLGRGYDFTWVLNPARRGAASVWVREPVSGRTMEVATTEPGVQFYSGNFLDGSWSGKSGKAYKSRHGFCLETQHFPDSPNRPSFPSTVLRPGEEFRSTTVYRFGTY